MSDTFLFDDIVFGPIYSRRLGSSLGINVLPTDCKYCNFDCVYCECGWTDKKSFHTITFPDYKTVIQALEQKLVLLQKNNNEPDVITFAGNGEPTLHPDFSKIIDDVILLRNKYFRNTKIAVLTNSTTVLKDEIFQSLKKIEMNIMKLDSANSETISLINQPSGNFNIQEIIRRFKEFDGNLYIQTLFVQGKSGNKIIDNTTETEIQNWLDVINKIRPKQVMIYTIARGTPLKNLDKIPIHKLELIAAEVKKLGIDTLVAG